jgi:class 3 adenylate cyclase
MRFCGHCGAPAAALPAAPALDEERRLVTALFADLSGFTELASHVDPEDLQEVVDPVLAALSKVIAHYEGQVEKFAGDAVLALFGVPVSHEDDAHRALLAAQEMHGAVARLLPRLPTAAAGLALHIGVETGHVVARLVGSDIRLDYGVLGDCVVRAQRLEAAAPAGATYLGDTTWRHVSGRIRASRVEPVVAKGFTEPLGAWRLDGGWSPPGGCCRTSHVWARPH